MVKSVAGAGDAAVDVGIISLVYRRAIAARDWLVAISALCGILCVVAAVAAMEWAMIRPLIALDREMSAMSRAEAQVGRLKADRGDEIGRLAHSANLLLERVQAGRRDAQEQRELLSSVLDSTTEGVMAFRCVRDADGRIADLTIISANHSAEKMLRVTISDIVGCSVRETYPRLIRAGVYDRWVRVAETGEPAVFESFYEGHRIAGWFLYAIAPWGDGVVVTFRDISERKAREKELAESYAEMERFNAAMIGREERIIEMKREVNALRAQLDLPPVYQMEEGHDS